ncbi:MAG: endonuclease/exonuclease/phosphatase family protein, partial [Bacteroidales bacterium]|nr:endonuclease/exonuclease/phosphatase family protein [Bacteroidales bacterium]
AETKKKRKGFFGITARALMLIAAGLLALSYLSIVANPAKAWFLTFFGLLFIPAAGLNFLLLLWGIRRKSKATFIPLIALLPAFFLMGRYIQFGKTAAPEEGSVKIVSYNVGRFSGGKHIDKDACVDSVEAFLKRTNADIICLQEFHIPSKTNLKTYLKSHFPGYESEYYMFVGKKYSYGNVTLSKLPIKGKGKFDFEKSANLALSTDIAIGGTTLRVYNCHFESYNVSIKGVTDAIRNDNEEAVRETEEKMKSSITRRPQQVEEVMADIEASPVESIVLGDFNDTPLSYTYHRLSKGRNDTFVEAGKGFGASFRELWPFIRIDYILYPDHYKAISHKTPHVTFSDHYPVVAEISF